MSSNTISDKEWRELQKRAAKANPEWNRSGSEKSVKAAKRGKQNYDKRNQN